MDRNSRHREPYSDRAMAVGATVDFSLLRAQALALANPDLHTRIPTFSIGKHRVGIQVTRDVFTFGPSQVWMAFVGVRDMMDRVIATDSWSDHRRACLLDLLRRALSGVGDETRERLFRMQPALCLERALTPAESAEIPAERQALKAAHIFGGPVELFSSFVDVTAGNPCEKPTRQYHRRQQKRGGFGSIETDLWVPIDCGECPPCLAREKIREELEIEGGGVFVRF